MEYKDVPDARQYLTDWWEEIELFRQNWFMGESQFLTFARDRGLPAWGVTTGEPGDFFRHGWLDADEIDSEGNPRFHPFRMYPLHRILSACDLRIAPAVFLNPDSALRLTKSQLERVSSGELRTLSRDWNNVVTLAVVLEPIYWPRIVGSQRLPGGMSEQASRKRLETFQAKTLGLVRSLDPSFWRNVHECLRIDAAWMDNNPHLYMLLRVAAWAERERLRGPVSGALWIRHMAEVIRRAFEEVHSQRWPEEDQAFGHWPAGARSITFGSERPLDDVLAAKPYLAHTFGLFTGSAVRWYLEGDTEYFAVLEMFADISRFGIELYDLKGGIASGKNNTPLKLEALLNEDRSLRRFSMLSFDGDVPANIKYVRRQVEQDKVVGVITIHDPDYEFANFSINELVEVAAKIDEALGFPGDLVRHADWTGVKSSKGFEKKYLEVSARKPGALKDEKWGRALARYAMEHPDRPDGTRRPLWGDLRAALHAWSSNYDRQRDLFTFDPVTFEQIPRQSTSKP